MANKELEGLNSESRAEMKEWLQKQRVITSLVSVIPIISLILWLIIFGFPWPFAITVIHNFISWPIIFWTFYRIWYFRQSNWDGM